MLSSLIVFIVILQSIHHCSHHENASELLDTNNSHCLSAEQHSSNCNICLFQFNSTELEDNQLDLQYLPVFNEESKIYVDDYFGTQELSLASLRGPPIV